MVTPGAWADPQGCLCAEEAVREVAAGQWYGTANVLSPEHTRRVASDRRGGRVPHANPGTAFEEDFSGYPSEGELFEPPVRSGSFTAERVILGRRSAVSMDASTAISAATFFRMLARLVPTRGERQMPWDAIPWRPRIHLGLFVHRVNGLSPGLYALARDAAKVEALRESMRPDFLWQRPPSCPRGLPLYLLKEGDCRALAASVSCGQDIAGDGAFSLGMIADYMDSLRCLRRSVLPKPLLGGRSRRPGAVPRGGRGGHSFDRNRLLLRRSGSRGVRHHFARLAELLSLHRRWPRRGRPAHHLASLRVAALTGDWTDSLEGDPMDATAFVQELEAFKADRLSPIVGAGRTSLADGAPGDAKKMLQVALANEISVSELAAAWMPTTPEIDVKLALRATGRRRGRSLSARGRGSARGARVRRRRSSGRPATVRCFST